MSEKKKKIAPTEDKSNTSEPEMLKYEIDVEQILLHQRNVFLHGLIDDKSANAINKRLLALSNIEDKPIALWINSGGGSISSGFAIIDTMRGLAVPVYTFISGYACSMAGLISVAGHKRVITTHSIWMGHEAYVGGDDYVSKMMDREKYFKLIDKQITDHFKKYTKFNKTDLQKCKKGELWLTATECKRKGVVDVIARV